MRQALPTPGQSQRHSTSADDRPTAPLDVYYVVQTTAGVIGKRHHRVHPPLYETRSQAQAELMHLEAASPGSGTYSIWKATTYVEPAEWLYDVVVADGSLIRPRGRDLQRSANRHCEARSLS